MGWPVATLVPRDVQLARLVIVIGNTISPVHALVTLARVALILPAVASPEKRNKSFFDLVTPLLNAIPKLPTCEIHSDEEFLWLQPSIKPSVVLVKPDGGEVDDPVVEHDPYMTQLDPLTQPDDTASVDNPVEPPLKKTKFESPIVASKMFRVILTKILCLSQLNPWKMSSF